MRMRLLGARNSDSYSLALLRKTFGWETEKWDLRWSAKTEVDSLAEEHLGNLGEEIDEKEEPATERKRKYTDLREREGHVACHVSVLALAVTDEACLEA